MPDNPRWKRRPVGSTWGDWGPDDQLGRLNLLTPDKVLKAVAEVKEGKTFCLSLPLDYPGGTVVNPRRHPPKLSANKRNGMPYIAYPLNREDPQYLDVICDDVVEMTLQYSTQWDSLAHVGQLFDVDGEGKPEMVFYNGYPGRRGHRRPDGLPRRRRGRTRRACRRAEAVDRPHGGARHAGPRGDDRPRTPFRPRRQVRLLRRADAGDGGRQGRGRGRRSRLFPHRLRPGDPRHEQEPRRRDPRRQPLRRARRARRTDLQLDHQDRARGAHFGQPRGRGLALAPVRRRGPLRLLADPRALPVQARRLSRRDLVAVGAGRLAAAQWTARASC